MTDKKHSSKQQSFEENEGLDQTWTSQTRKWYFYHKSKSRGIVPVKEKGINPKAREKLKEIHKEYNEQLPRKFRDNWSDVRLYNPKGNLEKAHAILINPEEGAYDLKNKLNHMTGKEWTKFGCSHFTFNALPSDLKEEKEICGDSEDHPATYSPTMMEDFIRYFTKEGMSVLDPFAGIGSTLVGCQRTGRVGYGIELNKKYCDMIVKRVPEFKSNLVCGDSRKVKEHFKKQKFNFCISSPPYWDVLNRSTDNFEKDRNAKGLDSKYSDEETDLGNIDDYDLFLKELIGIYLDIYDLLEQGSFIVIIVKNVKKEGKFYTLAWDIARELSEKYELKDEKIWIQDQQRLSPYAYPWNWSANILHHYCIILRKENGR